MFRRRNNKTRVQTVPLPNELWLIIFDIVIREGIIWLDQCDYTTFPHMRASLSAPTRRYLFYGSYSRLRLVCRRFNTLLGAPPWQAFLNSSLLPFSTTTRALYLDFDGLSKPHFQRLCAERLTHGRLVLLDVTCGLSQSSDRLNISDFLRAGRVFRNVQRLTLRLVNGPFSQPEVAFWARLNRAFPFLMTLVILTNYWNATGVPRLEDDESIYLERLEIMYFSSAVTYSGCRFPRLRQASVWGCTLSELEILTSSPHLESLLIRAYLDGFSNVDVTSCSRLKLLGFPYNLLTGVAPLGFNHPVEHIWLYCTFSLSNPELFKWLSRTVPNITRITVEFSDLQFYKSRMEDLRRIDLDSFRLLTRSPAHSDRLLVFERERLAAGVTSGLLRKVWGKMRR
jgi:hypothetical protein